MKSLISSLLALLCTLALAVEPEAVAPQLEGRYYGLLKELRCLVCQNESLYESHAELAGDLRREVREMLEKNQSDQEILAYMVARYGDFVLYRPRLRPATYALWFGPWILLFAGLLIGFRLWKNQAGPDQHTRPLSKIDRERLDALLKEQHGANKQ